MTIAIEAVTATGVHTLGGVNLPPGTVWVDRHQENLVGQQFRRGLAGNVHIRAQRVLVGQPITLSIEVPRIWLHQAQYAALKALADVAAAEYDFVWQPCDVDAQGVVTALMSETRRVVFRHHDAPALDFTRVEEAPSNYDLITGQIKLVTTGART